MLKKTVQPDAAHRNSVVTLWDPLLRLLHWIFAIVYFANFFINEPGEDWHEYLGYTAVFALLIRVVWSFCGPASAGWKHFFPSIANTAEQLAALKKGQQYSRLGHTPLGGLVMLLIFLLFASLGVTGFMMEEIDAFWGEDWVQILHHWLANFLTGIIGLHLMAATYQTIKTKENYFLSMITGKRRVG